ncbi:hypothetical protein RSAG8_12430, partial [Rhizoctonia solani AG-8 WAC10335]
MLEVTSNKCSGLQRSKKGCLTCRRKRKKCDENSPVCSRCEKSDSQCIWPQQSAHSTDSQGEYINAVPVFPAFPTGFGANSISSPSFVYRYPLAQSESLWATTTGTIPSATDARLQDLNTTGDSLTLAPSFDQTGFLQSATTPNKVTPPVARSPLVSARSEHLTLKSWEYAQDYGPRIIWPPKDLEGSHDFDPEGVMPTLHQSIHFLTRTVVIEPVFQEIFHFWSTFLSRIFYDYAIFPGSIAGWMLQRFRSPLTDSLRRHAKELYSLASRQISLELKNDELPPQVKLVGLIEVTNYEYYSSTLSRYYPHVIEAASIVRQIIGGDTIDLLNLSGKHTFDVRCFAWCDVLQSMAASRPTMFKYESDIEEAQRFGYVGGYANPDKGVEWIYGCPDVLTVLMARITALKHSSASKEDKTHAATLYLHQAIFQSEPTYPAVRNSVRNIVRIASTLKPGVNPDCFLSVPYFIAGSFAISQKDRYTLRSRVLSCGNEPFLRNLAFSLEDMWAESDATGRFTSWSDKEPPTVVF